MLDLIIRGGAVVDGSGAPRRHADVGIRGGRVVAIGDVDEGSRRVVDAEGRIVAPGFVDVHTHLDAQLFWDPALTPSSLHGVTTVVAGNCGFSIAPLDGTAADFLMRMLARVEGMPLEALAAGVPWDWTTTDSFLTRADELLAVNAGFMVGHCAIRRVVMGEAASEREATPDELAAMTDVLGRALAAGGLGFSSSTSTAHSDPDGRPVPSRLASTDELIALSAVCGEHPGTSLELAPELGNPGPASMALMARMSAAAGRPINWNVLMPNAGNLDGCRSTLEASRRSTEQGGRIVTLVMPVTISTRYTFLSEFTWAMLPGWGEVMALPVPERIRRFQDPAERARLAALAAEARATVPAAWWERLTIDQVFSPELEPYEGRSVGEIATARGASPFDALMDIVCADELRTVLRREPGTSRADWDARREVLEDPSTMIGGSDAGAHLDVFGTFNYVTRLFEEAVRGQELFTVEQLVHEVTEVPARLYGIRDRGRLVEGGAADVVIFDEATVGSDPLKMRNDLPAGAARLFAGAQGISTVMVGGEEIVVDGEPTGARPGRVLRSGADVATPSMR